MKKLRLNFIEIVHSSFFLALCLTTFLNSCKSLEIESNSKAKATSSNAQQSQWIYYGSNNRLVFARDQLGNRIPDFSKAGYLFGKQPPSPSDLKLKILKIVPIRGDNTGHIQKAISEVSKWPVSKSGYRGIIQMSAGVFNVSGSIRLENSGVILRGEDYPSGQSPPTKILASGTLKRSVIVVGKNESSPATRNNPNKHIFTTVGPKVSISDKFVPMGAGSFDLDDASSFQKGDLIAVTRPSTKKWLSSIGMDRIPPNRIDPRESTVVQWKTANTSLTWERIVSAIDGNRIHLNAPLTHSLSKDFGGGVVQKIDSIRIDYIGIENIFCESSYLKKGDEDHAQTFIEFRSAEHSWARFI